MNVADERIFTPRPCATSSPPAPNAEFRLLYHGTIHERYGLDLAIRAVSLLREEIPEIRLEILGRGPHVAALAALRDQLGLDGHVSLTDGFVLATDLPPIIARADLAVVPYRDDPFTDGLLPTKLMEYAVMQVACVAARTSAIEAHFRDTMVEFFTPGDAEDLARCIKRLRSDPGRLAELSRRSRNFTSRYSWEDIGSRYAALIRGLAEAGRPGDVRSRMRRSPTTTSGGCRGRMTISIIEAHRGAARPRPSRGPGS
jgi:glycosyltransferase involved in cell wall biosynthesis